MDSRKSDGKREKDIYRIVDEGAFGAGTEEAYGKALTYDFTEEDIAGWVPQETEEGSDR